MWGAFRWTLICFFASLLALQADFVISSMRWAIKLHDFAIRHGFDKHRRCGSLKKLRIRIDHDTDRYRDKLLDTKGWMEFVEDVDGALEMKAERYYSFMRRLLDVSHRLPQMTYLNSHLLDTYFLFELPFECSRSIQDNEARRFDVERNHPKGRSKCSDVYFRQHEFRLPVLSDDPKSPLFEILPVFCDKSDITDPHVKSNRV